MKVQHSNKIQESRKQYRLIWDRDLLGGFMGAIKFERCEFECSTKIECLVSFIRCPLLPTIVPHLAGVVHRNQCYTLTVTIGTSEQFTKHVIDCCKQPPN